MKYEKKHTYTQTRAHTPTHTNRWWNFPTCCNIIHRSEVERDCCQKLQGDSRLVVVQKTKNFAPVSHQLKLK